MGLVIVLVLRFENPPNNCHAFVYQQLAEHIGVLFYDFVCYFGNDCSKILTDISRFVPLLLLWLDIMGTAYFKESSNSEQENQG